MKEDSFPVRVRKTGPKYREQKRIEARKVLLVESNPWDYLGAPRNHIIICNNLITDVVPKLLNDVPLHDRVGACHGQTVTSFYGDKLYVRPFRATGGTLIGGFVELTRRDRRIRIYDTKGWGGTFSAQSFWNMIADLWKVGEEVGLNLLPVRKQYTSIGRILPNLLTPALVAAARIPEELSDIKATGPYIRCQCFGTTSGGAWLSDVKNAYLYPVTLLFPEQGKKLTHALTLCKTQEARIVLKSLYSRIPGIMNRRGKYYRPECAQFCYGWTQKKRLFPLLDSIDAVGGQEYRSHTDGSITDTKPDIEWHPEPQPGQWKRPVRLSRLTIADTNTWFSPQRSCDGLLVKYGLTEERLIQHFREFGDKPLSLPIRRFSYREATWVNEERSVRFNHDTRNCASCLEGRGGPDVSMHLKKLSPDTYGGAEDGIYAMGADGADGY